jgi:VWFA-related protein
VDVGGTSSNDNTSIEYKSGRMERPVERRSTSTGGAGLRVRIIPSTQPLGATRDDNTMYDDPKNDPKNDDNDPIFNPTNSRDSQSSSGVDTTVPRTGSNQASPPAFDRPAEATQQQPASVVDDPDDRQGQVASTGSGPNAAPDLRRSRVEEDSVNPTAAAKPSHDPNASADDAIKLNSSVVNLNVVVTDRSGKALANLKKEDFQPAENGDPQRIEFFAPSTAPFNLVLLLDLSGSIQDKLDMVKASALKFIDVIGPNDKVAVVTFTHEVRVISQLTNNRDLLRTRIQSIPRATSGTAFYEAMWFTVVDTLRGTEGQRNAIVVMTDGVDSSLDRYSPAPTRVSFNRLAGRLEESDVIVFPIYLDTEYEEVFERQQSTTEAYAMARSQLERIAELTGGQIFQAQEAKDLSGVYKQVAAALRTVYSVGYHPTNGEKDGSYRKVRIVVDRNGAAVRTRRGYYAK